MDAVVENGHIKPFFSKYSWNMVLPMSVLTFETHEIFKGKKWIETEGKYNL